MSVPRVTRCVLVMLFMGWTALAHSEAGRFQFVFGDVVVHHPNGRTTPAVKGGWVEEGDSVATGPQAQAQLLMKDDGLIAIRPDSRLLIEVYKFAQKGDPNDKGVFNLIRGGFRSITGLIGRANKDNYQVRTVISTIGIRGTDHEPFFIPTPGPGESSVGPPGTYDKVNSGQTYLETSAGRVDIGPNQVAYVANTPNAVPVRLPFVPSFLAVTPPVQSQSKASPRDGETTSEAKAGAAASSGSDTKSEADTTTAGQDANTAPAAASSNEGVAAGLAAPATVVATPAKPGVFNPANPNAGGGIVAAAGTVIAGGGVGSNGPTNGAGSVGDPNSKLIVTLDATGAVVAVGSNNFSYSRDGAPPLMRGSAKEGSETINWGVYNGGTMVDSGVTSAKTVFFWMNSTSASTAANLLTALPSPGSMLTFNSVTGYTSPVNEAGKVGGTVSLNVELKNLSGVPSIHSYSLNVTDAASRTWAASMANPQSLDSFRSGGIQNLSGTCSGAGCAQSTATGNAQGVAIGNPSVVGLVSSYKLTAGTSAVAGAAAVKP